MKGTIASLVLLALELTLCLVSPRWRSIDVSNSEICFKNIFTQFNTSPVEHQALHVGPIFASRVPKADSTPEHFASDHARTETALLISGIAVIVLSAATLSFVEFCSTKPIFNRYRTWLHLINVVFLTISLVILIVGFYFLQFRLEHPLNGAGAMGFFAGILFLVMLGTYSAVTFFTRARDRWEPNVEKILM